MTKKASAPRYLPALLVAFLLAAAAGIAYFTTQGGIFDIRPKASTRRVATIRSWEFNTKDNLEGWRNAYNFTPLSIQIDNQSGQGWLQARYTGSIPGSGLLARSLDLLVSDALNSSVNFSLSVSSPQLSRPQGVGNTTPSRPTLAYIRVQLQDDAWVRSTPIPLIVDGQFHTYELSFPTTRNFSYDSLGNLQPTAISIDDQSVIVSADDLVNEANYLAKVVMEEKAGWKTPGTSVKLIQLEIRPDDRALVTRLDWMRILEPVGTSSPVPSVAITPVIQPAY